MSTVANFSVDFTQYVDESGKSVIDLPKWTTQRELLLALYRNMVEANTFDKKAIALQRTGRMGTYAPISGQEAISTAIGHAMQKDDVLVPYYRDYAAQFQRGVKMSEILSYWGGDERGSSYACGSEDFPISVPIASQCLHAAGVAFAFKYRNQARVAVVCLGEGGTSEGDFYEAMNAAGVWKLPVVFVVNNNQWAISVPLSKQTATETIAQKAIAAGFKGEQVDGNDVIACREVIGKAIESARSGNGPTLVEALTYRLCDHTTADDATRYQPLEEVTHAKTREPISRMRTYLIEQGLWSQSEEQALLESASSKVSQAVEEYLSATPQPVEAMFDYHFAQLPDYLQEQRESATEDSHHA